MAFLCGLALSVTALAAISAENVYYGNQNKYKKPVEINAKKVFAVIPAYKEIVDKKIPADSALYMVKLDEANKVFAKVLKSFAADNKYDLVCEEGSVKDAPNATDDVVKLVKELKEDSKGSQDSKGGESKEKQSGDKESGGSSEKESK